MIELPTEHTNTNNESNNFSHANIIEGTRSNSEFYNSPPQIVVGIPVVLPNNINLQNRRADVIYIEMKIYYRFRFQRALLYILFCFEAFHIALAMYFVCVYLAGGALLNLKGPEDEFDNFYALIFIAIPYHILVCLSLYQPLKNMNNMPEITQENWENYYNIWNKCKIRVFIIKIVQVLLIYHFIPFLGGELLNIIFIGLFLLSCHLLISSVKNLINEIVTKTRIPVLQFISFVFLNISILSLFLYLCMML